MLWSIWPRKTYEWAISMGAWAWDWSSNMLIIGYPINRSKKCSKIHPPLVRNSYPINRLGLLTVPIFHSFFTYFNFIFEPFLKNQTMPLLVQKQSFLLSFSHFIFLILLNSALTCHLLQSPLPSPTTVNHSHHHNVLLNETR